MKPLPTTFIFPTDWQL